MHCPSATTVSQSDVRIGETMLSPSRPFDALEEWGWSEGAGHLMFFGLWFLVFGLSVFGCLTSKQRPKAKDQTYKALVSDLCAIFDSLPKL